MKPDYQRRAMELEVALKRLVFSVDLAREEVAPGHRREFLEEDFNKAKSLLQDVEAARREEMDAMFRETLKERV